MITVVMILWTAVNFYRCSSLKNELEEDAATLFSERNQNRQAITFTAVPTKE